MNKNELIEHVAETVGLTKKEARTAVSAVFDQIASSLNTGDTVAIAGFGTFLVKDRAARIGRNPSSGAPMNIPASKAPSFKVAKALKDSCNIVANQ
jgi:DNA-binding protein HU-beta